MWSCCSPRVGSAGIPHAQSCPGMTERESWLSSPAPARAECTPAAGLGAQPPSLLADVHVQWMSPAPGAALPFCQWKWLWNHNSPAAAPSWPSHIPVTLQCFLMAVQHREPITAGESKQLNQMCWKLKIRGEKKSLQVLGKLLVSTWSKFLQPGERFECAGCGCVFFSWGLFLEPWLWGWHRSGMQWGSVPSWAARGDRERSGCSSWSLLAFRACE